MSNKKKTPVKRGTKKDAYASIASIARYMHRTVARHCDICGKPMTPSNVNDFGTLCESCYMKEYY